MIKDFFISFKDNFSEKTKNPFLGAYLIVWLIRNWELVYTIFNFDDDQKLKDKVKFIKEFYSNGEFLENLSINICWAFLVLIVTYLLLNLSRLIVNLSEKQLTPWIYKLTDSKSIVLKSVYDAVKFERDELQIRLDQERDSKSKLESRIKNLEIEKFELLNSHTENENLQSNNISNHQLLIIEKLKEKNLLNDFKDIGIRIKKGEFIKNEYKPKDEFIAMGLINFIQNSAGSSSKSYSLSKDGEVIFKKLNFE